MADNLNSRFDGMALPRGVQIKGQVSREHAEILSPQAVEFVASLCRKFNARRLELLRQREIRQSEFDAGRLPDFLPQTATIRQLKWKAPPVPLPLQRAKIGVFGPAERKFIVGVLNSAAGIFMADLEDSHTPTWLNNVSSQANLRDAASETISFTDSEGKRVGLDGSRVLLMLRLRGWHTQDNHFLVDNQPVSGSLFDFGIFFFHNAQRLVLQGTGPYFCLSNIENHAEARLWNDVFLWAQAAVGIPAGRLKAAVAIETITAAFEMDEILYELKQHAAGLLYSRSNYIFSMIKRFKNDPSMVFPDRSEMTMDKKCLKSFAELLVATCRQRGVCAMGELDPAAKTQDARAGFDTAWVADPALAGETSVPASDAAVSRTDDEQGSVRPSLKDLLSAPAGEITETGLRLNIHIGIRYLESWLRGIGRVRLNGVFENAATAEMCRSQIWQWIRHGARLSDGAVITRGLVAEMMQGEIEAIRRTEEGGRLTGLMQASHLFIKMMTAPDIPEFFTQIASELID